VEVVKHQHVGAFNFNLPSLISDAVGLSQVMDYLKGPENAQSNRQVNAYDVWPDTRELIIRYVEL